MTLQNLELLYQLKINYILSREYQTLFQVIKDFLSNLKLRSLAFSFQKVYYFKGDLEIAQKT
jgi:hypothetical protein